MHFPLIPVPILIFTWMAVGLFATALMRIGEEHSFKIYWWLFGVIFAPIAIVALIGYGTWWLLNKSL